MKVIDPLSVSEQVIETLKQGAFLTTKLDGKINTMTIGWGSIGFIWGGPVFMAMVRKSRFTWSFLEKSHEFTVSVPTHDMRAALAICGTKSGRDIDKFATASLTAQKSQKLDTPVIASAGMHFECKVVYQQDMLPKNLSAAVTDRWYGDNDWHTLYFGEIVAAYKD
ncbi:flavin reductase family protein [Pectinatus cerevisiiphilus]|uniref:Flavin reductase like protein n=1 Tax=Pectinatus cerevisiiphilus TaxID=86956 RepID=A0A4R3KDU2_9FIRM|nr:flavin reductase family protein [Pectinatus cerevisiiphilus]TCS81338.1 flavin reductase like protein [Pectinatus cerevisiiphilus]